MSKIFLRQTLTKKILDIFDSLSLYIFTIWKCIAYNFFWRDGIYFDKILVSEYKLDEKINDRCVPSTNGTCWKKMVRSGGDIEWIISKNIYNVKCKIMNFESYLENSVLKTKSIIFIKLVIYIVTFVHWYIVQTESCMYKLVLRKINYNWYIKQTFCYMI